MAFQTSRHGLSSRDRMSTIHRRNIFVLKIVFGIAIFIAFLSFFFATIQSGSVSMEPTLVKGTRSIYHPVQSSKYIERGDVILINSPYYGQENLFVRVLNKVVGFVTFQKLQVPSYPREAWVNSYMIKRVIAQPGDTIKMEDWVVYIKSSEERFYLSEFESTKSEYDIHIAEDRLKLENGEVFSGYLPEMVLNEGEYFVLGDNRRFSNDSYYWGVLSENNIKGKLLFSYWPLSNFGVIH